MMADLCSDEPNLWKDMLCDLETAIRSHFKVLTS